MGFGLSLRLMLITDGRPYRYVSTNHRGWSGGLGATQGGAQAGRRLGLSFVYPGSIDHLNANSTRRDATPVALGFRRWDATEVRVFEP
jgi:hypothetical protein